MAKAGVDLLRKAENAQWVADGKAIERAWKLSGLLLKEFAGRVGRNERQIARWMRGAERPQLETVLAGHGLKRWMVIALAQDADGVEVVTQILVKAS